MMTSDQLRAARILLHLDQRDLAAMSLVGVATVRRFEAGEEIGALQREAIRRAVEDAGAILLASGQDLGGREIEGGVALRKRELLPQATRERLASGDWGRRKRPARADAPVDADGRAEGSQPRSTTAG